MKNKKFLLVHSRKPPAGDMKPAEMMTAWGLDMPEIEGMLSAANVRLLKSVVHTALGPTIADPGRFSFAVDAPAVAALETLRGIGRELTRQPKVETVGIWDLDAWVTELQSMIETLNAAQPAITFFEVHAGIPVGLIGRPERITAWAEERLGKQLSKAKREEIAINVLANDFFGRAEVVRKDLGIDYLVGVTRALVAGEDDDSIYWNLFAFNQSKSALVSTADLRGYAQKAGRPFEVAVAGMITSILLSMMNPRIEFFHDNSGCIFDYHELRHTIVEELTSPSLEEACLRKIRPSLREPALALVEVLKSYKGATSV